MSERVTLTFDGPIAHVQLNRPEKHNGLDARMFDALVGTGKALLGRHDVRAVVLSGAGPSFCAGMDFPSFMGDPSSMTHLLHRTEESPANVAQRVAWIWAELEVPVIAALHGAVYGGGLQIALAADIRYAASDTRMSVMETRYGLIPDMSITQTLTRLVRTDVARELVYTARILDAVEAARLGLVTQLVDDPIATAFETARRIAAASPHAIRGAKRLLNQVPDLDTKAALALETEIQMALLASPNQLEAVQASFMKRPPVFQDPE